MRRKTILGPAPLLMLIITLPLRAQTGCVDSPEDPTIVLGLLSVAGALIIRGRITWKRRGKP